MNARMEQRVSRLEDASCAADSPVVDCIVLVSMRSEGEDSPEIVGLSGKGIHVDRLPNEEYNVFSDRAQALMRQRKPAGILMMSACYQGDEIPDGEVSNAQQKGTSHA